MYPGQVAASIGAVSAPAALGCWGGAVCFGRGSDRSVSLLPCAPPQTGTAAGAAPELRNTISADQRLQRMMFRPVSCLHRNQLPVRRQPTLEVFELQMRRKIRRN